jgi:hypothetical protein
MFGSRTDDAPNKALVRHEVADVTAVQSIN